MTRTGTLILAVLLATAPARAESPPGSGEVGTGALRLRGDVFVAAEPPVGLLMLEGEERGRDWLSVEAMVWSGLDSIQDNGDGDALVALVKLRDPKGRGDARLGRFVITGGAIRPLHLDGAAFHGRRWGFDAEVFGGVPVSPLIPVDGLTMPGTYQAELEGRSYDWVAGARLSEQIGDMASVGVSYYHQRDGGYLADEEVGVTATLTPVKFIDVAARAAYDTVNTGLADAHLSGVARLGRLRLEAFGARRSPSRLLPATSLFSVLGDVPSDEIGAAARLRAAPRLDVWASASVLRTGGAEPMDGDMEMAIDAETGADMTLRALLRLDERGAGALGLQLRRRGIGELSSWTGVRATARVPLRNRLSAATELELVVPDQRDDRGKVWPWALAALSWQPSPWTLSAGVEGRSSPEHRRAFSAMFQLGRRWEGL